MGWFGEIYENGMEVPEEVKEESKKITRQPGPKEEKWKKRRERRRQEAEKGGLERR